tara:strand:+ start:219 stop:446 length:228 start_codon:yes stop_codon:yes gene_type:complete
MMWIKFEHFKPWYEGTCLVRGKDDSEFYLAEYIPDSLLPEEEIYKAWTVYQHGAQMEAGLFLREKDVFEWMPIPF